MHIYKTLSTTKENYKTILSLVFFSVLTIQEMTMQVPNTFACKKDDIKKNIRLAKPSIICIHLKITEIQIIQKNTCERVTWDLTP